MEFISLFVLIALMVFLSGCIFVEYTPTNRPDLSKAKPESTFNLEGYKMNEVEQGDKVFVHYLGALDDGTVFDGSVDENKSEKREPLSFTAGAGQMIKGFDEAVIGMKLDEEKDIHLTPDKAYGERNEALIQEAYDRTKTEVRASHILIKVDPKASPEDTLKAYNQLKALKKRIDAGEDFAVVAKGKGGSEDRRTGRGRRV